MSNLSGHDRVLWNAPPADGGSSITKYKIEWDPDETFGSGGDGGALGSHQKVVTDSSQCGSSPCEYTVPSLAKGQPYHVRVFAYNQASQQETASIRVREFERSWSNFATRPPVSSPTKRNLANT